ncbi:6-carboxytetrahydropterin synthase [Altererythrobacter sp. CC-YST694]|jgi:6-pyruvoyltetrahydropterin/6-carboxytetrahydropterin synthase|nr:6-carboxytetrahydropterin synthase [Altererythrobacter sp. CC-YST694]MAT33755.1 6-carboxytetrahydropterin synthase QueD [Ponticaulis sp.]MCA0978502.1 6-carboxytetrahydropterin synthase [Qipengyuania flava]MCB5423725.1 6-carboxytetrahydropterin synthase [Altererythrobacter sp. CC-YST694]|tara:strand:- start:36319 stop:36693 length:375 start_codon:yes stop_codon:yes gene_type:complete
MYELSKQFRFDAAHTLDRVVQTESSRRIHGHSYRGEVTLRGRPDPVSGMIVDVGILEKELESVRDALDHRFLDDINDLGPATMENLCRWIWNRLKPEFPALSKVSVYRDSNSDAVTYWGEEELA